VSRCNPLLLLLLLLTMRIASLAKRWSQVLRRIVFIRVVFNRVT
jgi:hypothetical protein